MLNLSLNEVARGDVVVRGEIAPDDPVWEGDRLRLREPVRVDLVARSVGEGVLVRGQLRARLEMECRRCLKEVSTEVDETVDLLFEPLAAEEEEALGGEVYPLPPRGDVIDLTPAVREQLLLQVPEFVVCSEACRGLCPQCGADLNQGSCDCVPEASPSPWDALKNVKFD